MLRVVRRSLPSTLQAVRKRLRMVWREWGTLGRPRREEATKGSWGEHLAARAPLSRRTGLLAYPCPTRAARFADGRPWRRQWEFVDGVAAWPCVRRACAGGPPR